MIDSSRFKVNNESLDSDIFLNETGDIKSSFKETIKSTIIEIIDHVKEAIFDGKNNSIYKGKAGIALLLIHFNKFLGPSTGQYYSISKDYFASSSSLLAQSSYSQSHDFQYSTLSPSSSTFLTGQIGIDSIYIQYCNLKGNNSHGNERTCPKKLLSSQSSLEDSSSFLSFSDSYSFPPFYDSLESFTPSFDAYELLYGYSGYLYALYYLEPFHDNKDQIKRIIKLIFKEGLKADEYDYFPLMFKWHGTLYLGPAHGLFGILCMLVVKPEFLTKEQIRVIKETVMKLINDKEDTRYSPSGNFKSSIESGKSHDKLVQWCHGAPGAAISLGYLLEKDNELKWTKREREMILETIKEMTLITWKRGLLTKGIGLCHGIAGNGYAFLTAYKVTGDSEYLLKALAFAKYIINEIKNKKKFDEDNSLFGGNGGGAYFLIDLLNYKDYKGFPAFTDI